MVDPESGGIRTQRSARLRAAAKRQSSRRSSRSGLRIPPSPPDPPARPGLRGLGTCGTKRPASVPAGHRVLLGERPNQTGEVPEWSNGAVSKTVDRASGPWVRIPPSPPDRHAWPEHRVVRAKRTSQPELGGIRTHRSRACARPPEGRVRNEVRAADFESHPLRQTHARPELGGLGA